ncbi:Shedu anti-phage system protein SduA domain-containing protein [Nonomuraea sp. NPDC049784]|uniref:Shedu anti-phage system protein SduA domain-containing protein n=1 Tax=Nonomuraea sp. NPDC049784 TaxID=3154361 RepID=UPI0033DFAC12
MTETMSPAANFHQPFVGHLPGYLVANKATAPGRPLQEVYDAALMERWRALLDSSASQDERLVHTFLERHPSLLPGAHSVDGDSGHSAFPMAVISKPKLPGLSDREPDFMWLATDSESLYPILIEIETPHKKWFHGDRAEIHSHFTHAQGQLAEWRAWFNRGHNRSAFLEHYPSASRNHCRRLRPRCPHRRRFVPGVARAGEAAAPNMNIAHDDALFAGWCLVLVVEACYRGGQALPRERAGVYLDDLQSVAPSGDSEGPR